MRTESNLVILSPSHLLNLCFVSDWKYANKMPRTLTNYCEALDPTGIRGVRKKMNKALQINDAVILLRNRILSDMFRDIYPSETETSRKRVIRWEDRGGDAQGNAVNRYSVLSKRKNRIEWFAHNE